jgi:predicted DCC family thiol-disulfide oxidoreductase YuxK
MNHGIAELFMFDRLTLSRMLLVFIAAGLVIAAILHRRRTRSIITEFFTASAAPINLAVFRVVVFGTLALSCKVSHVVWLAELPLELRFPPVGVQWLAGVIPISAAWVTAACTLLRVSAAAAMIGLFTRTSALFTVIAGLYVFGLPQLYGKVNHSHHLVWFPAILAASRCGDVFSIDAVRSAFKRADRGVIDPPAPSRGYALPLRFIWLLIGVIYFFPGFWKVWISGLDWAFSENLKFYMYKAWFLRNWVPSIRLDNYPLLYKLGALGTIVFELSFVVLIFFPRLRWAAVAGGIVFHTTTGRLMGIPFTSLKRSYVAFFDWDKIFRRIGLWLHSQPMYLIYDGNCRLCRRTIASLRTFDVFCRVTYINALDTPALKIHGLLWLDSKAMMNDIHAVVGTRHWAGFPAYRALAVRVPPLWPLLPFLYVWPVPNLANRLYRHVADSRSCDIVEDTPASAGWRGDAAWRQAPAVVAIGTILLVGNIYFGIKKMEASWPFACYPTFARIQSSHLTSLSMVAVGANGENIPLSQSALRARLSPGRLQGLSALILQTESPEVLRTRLTAFRQIWQRSHASGHEGEAIRIYKDTSIIVPERWKDNPVRRELVFELKL